MKVGFHSHAGQVRKANEDAVLADEDMRLYAVADGMGGHDAGEVASRIAVETLKEIVEQDLHQRKGHASEGNLPEVVRSAFLEANKRVLRQAADAKSDMATTLTCVLVRNGYFILGHVGDSRAYRIRDKSIEQLTDDHSLVAELVRRGSLTQEEADRHPHKNIVLRAIGSPEDPLVVDVRTISLEESDRIVLCSDGLTNVLCDSEILDVLVLYSNPRAAARKLVEVVNERGAPDNVSVLILQGPWKEPQERQTEHTVNLLSAALWVCLLSVLGMGLIFSVRNQYYLGVAGDQVVVYRGIPGAPTLLSPPRPVEEMHVAVAEVKQPYRDRLRHGVRVHDIQDARRRVRMHRVPDASSERAQSGPKVRNSLLNATVYPPSMQPQ